MGQLRPVIHKNKLLKISNKFNIYAIYNILNKSNLCYISVIFNKCAISTICYIFAISVMFEISDLSDFYNIDHCHIMGQNLHFVSEHYNNIPL
jgi:uncharacterized protein (DUF486 family)